jgi:hypothetical protein
VYPQGARSQYPAKLHKYVNEVVGNKIQKIHMYAVEEKFKSVELVTRLPSQQLNQHGFEINLIVIIPKPTHIVHILCSCFTLIF